MKCKLQKTNGVLHRYPRQERTRGFVAKDMEFIVERLMQDYKSSVGRRVSSGPEKTYINHVLEAEALNKCLLQHPHLSSTRSAILGSGPRIPRNGMQDNPGFFGATDNHRFMGAGSVVRAPDKRRTVSAAFTLLLRPPRPVPVKGWDGAAQPDQAEGGATFQASQCVTHGKAVSFDTAFVNGYTITAQGTGRARTRANYFILVKYETDTVVTPTVGIVRDFIRLQHTNNASADCLRIALVDLFTCVTDGRTIKATRFDPKNKMYPVLLKDISKKVVCCHPGKFMDFPMHFAQYENVGGYIV